MKFALPDEEDTVLANLRVASKPDRHVKVKGDVIAGAKYMFPYKPRVVLSKHKVNATCISA